MKIAKKTPNQ